MIASAWPTTSYCSGGIDSTCGRSAGCSGTITRTAGRVRLDVELDTAQAGERDIEIEAIRSAGDRHALIGHEDERVIGAASMWIDSLGSRSRRGRCLLEIPIRFVHGTHLDVLGCHFSVAMVHARAHLQRARRWRVGRATAGPDRTRPTTSPPWASFFAARPARRPRIRLVHGCSTSVPEVRPPVEEPAASAHHTAPC